MCTYSITVCKTDVRIFHQFLRGEKPLAVFRARFDKLSPPPFTRLASAPHFTTRGRRARRAIPLAVFWNASGTTSGAGRGITLVHHSGVGRGRRRMSPAARVDAEHI